MKNRIFGRIGSNLFILLVFLFSMTLALSISIPSARGAVYDDFNGIGINSALWRDNDTCHILSQSGGSLQVSDPANSCYGYLESVRRFSGDFEFVLEYSGFQSTATVRPNNVPQIEIQVTSSGNNFVSIWKGYFPGAAETNLFFSGAFVNGTPGASVSAPATSPSGSLKISRIGSTISTYYNKGMEWVRLGHFENTFASDVVLQIMVYTGDDGTFTVSSDNVYASDQVGTCQQQLQVLQDQVNTLTSQINAVNSGLSNIQQTLVQVFSNPQFTIPGATPLEQYQNLVNAILGLNSGRLQGLYMNLGGK